MNLLLLEPAEIDAQGRARLEGRRHQHAREVLRVQAGQTLKVGVRGGLVGTAEVLSEDGTALALQVHLAAPPPPRAGVDLILAIPRPKALKRILPAVASLGVDRVMLVAAARVEKSYFDSRVLADDCVGGLLDLGLEQARDTVAPTVGLRTRLQPFVEDELPGWCGGALRLLPHPAGEAPCPVVAAGQRVVLALGPDGGWVPAEVALFEAAGFQAFSLGPRVLRGEVAVPTVLGLVQARRAAWPFPPPALSSMLRNVKVPR
jgi:RsmE family RNA methyltransferase